MIVKLTKNLTSCVFVGEAMTVLPFVVLAPKPENIVAAGGLAAAVPWSSDFLLNEKEAVFGVATPNPTKS